MTPLERHGWAILWRSIERSDRAELAVLSDLRTERHPAVRILAARRRRSLVRAIDGDLRALELIDLGGEG